MRDILTCDAGRLVDGFVAYGQANPAAVPLAHGEPVHQGHGAELGITDLSQPDWGEPLPPAPGEVPLYWGCGLTANEALARADLPWYITHQPGRMFVTDLKA